MREVEPNYRWPRWRRENRWAKALRRNLARFEFLRHMVPVEDYERKLFAGFEVGRWEHIRFIESDQPCPR